MLQKHAQERAKRKTQILIGAILATRRLAVQRMQKSVIDKRS